VLLDPLPVAASSPNPAYSWAAIRIDGYGSERRDTSSGLLLTINHNKGTGGDRHYVKVTSVKDAADPYTGLTKKVQATVSLSVSAPPLGYTETELVNLVKTLLDTLADSDFTVTKWLQYQS